MADTNTPLFPPSQAERENDAIYHEKVLPLAQLPPIAPAGAVEPDAPGSLSDPSARDVFARLVSLDVHLAASAYSEQKAQVWPRGAVSGRSGCRAN